MKIRKYKTKLKKLAQKLLDNVQRDPEIYYTMIDIVRGSVDVYHNSDSKEIMYYVMDLLNNEENAWMNILYKDFYYIVSFDKCRMEIKKSKEPYFLHYVTIGWEEFEKIFNDLVEENIV